MTNSDVAHRWFHQQGSRNNPDGCDANHMFYRNNLIYSYGYHFILAMLFDGLVIYNDKTYSSSTTGHQSHVLHAVDQTTHEIFKVPLLSREIPSKCELKNLHKYIDYGSFVSQYQSHVAKLGRARKPVIYIAEINIIKERLIDIFSRFRGAKTFALKTKGMRSLLKFEATPEQMKAIKKAGEKARKEDAKRREEQKASDLDKLDKWIKGEINMYNFNNVARHFRGDTFIRPRTINDNPVIVTSKGKMIPRIAAKAFYRAMKRGQAVGLNVTDTQGHNWTCTGVNGVIKFGCHRIDTSHAIQVMESLD